jgi:predicted nucleic acid-binding protein
MVTTFIIADSSIWIDHINKGVPDFAALLKRRQIIIHPMIITEIALGSITNRSLMLGELHALPQARTASHSEVMEMIERLELFNCGVGYVDAHLLAATCLTANSQLWTRDKRLNALADRLGLAHPA